MGSSFSLYTSLIHSHCDCRTISKNGHGGILLPCGFVFISYKFGNWFVLLHMISVPSIQIFKIVIKTLSFIWTSKTLEGGNLRNEQYRVAACRDIVGNFLFTMKEAFNAKLDVWLCLCKKRSIWV